MTEAQPAAAPGSAADHAQAFAKPAPPEVPRADLLRDTAQHGRCQAAAAADAAPPALPPVPPPPPHALRTKLQLLQDQLEHVQELKRHYTGFYKACLAHLPALAASLHKSQHALLLNAPAKRAAPDGGAPADDAPPGKAHKAASADAPSSAPAADDGMAASDSKQVTSQTRPDPDALPSFSDAEDEALDAAASTSAASGGRGGGTAAPALAAWQGALAGSLAALGDQERMAAVAAAVEMDARNACAVLCGRRKRFYLHQTVTLLGRESKSKGEVRPRALRCALFAGCAPRSHVRPQLFCARTQLEPASRRRWTSTYRWRTQRARCRGCSACLRWTTCAGTCCATSGARRWWSTTRAWLRGARSSCRI